MASNLSGMDLVEGYDILAPDSDPDQVLKFAKQIRSCLRECSRKDLQPLVANVNNCYHNSTFTNSKINGIIILGLVAEECSDSVFEELGASWIQLVAGSIKKHQTSSTIYLAMACQVLKVLTRRAPGFPEVSRYMTSTASTLVTSLIAICERRSSPSLTNLAMEEVIVLCENYPGSCGSGKGQMEKFLVSCITDQSPMSKTILAKCLSLLPRLGGGGKEGIHHKANYVSMFQKQCYTLDSLITGILSISPNFKKESRNDISDKYQLPSCSNRDLFKKISFIQEQIDVTSECLCQLIVRPYPQPKSIQPGLVLNVIKPIFSMSLSDLQNQGSNEAKMLLFVIPSLMSSAFDLMEALLKGCGKAALLLAPLIQDKCLMTLSDLRNFTDSFKPLRMKIYSVMTCLCDTLGASSGLAAFDRDVVSYLLSDIVPPDQDSTITSIQQPAKKGKGNKNKYADVVRRKQRLNPDLMAMALDTLAAFLKASGPLISESIHKQVQCILISLGLEQSSKPLPVTVRRSLYECLFQLADKGHARSQPSLQLLGHAFQSGVNFERDPETWSTCHRGLALIMSKVHPGRSSMHLDMPLDVMTVEELKKDVMGVHVFYVGNKTATSTNSFSNFANDQVENQPSVSASVAQAEQSPTVEVPPETDMETDNGPPIADEFEEYKNKMVAEYKSKKFEAEIDKDIFDAEKNEQIVNEVYKLGDGKTGQIVIPEEVDKFYNNKERAEAAAAKSAKSSSEPAKKKAKLNEENDDFVSVEDMLKDFKPVLKS